MPRLTRSDGDSYGRPSTIRPAMLGVMPGSVSIRFRDAELRSSTGGACEPRWKTPQAARKSATATAARGRDRFRIDARPYSDRRASAEESPEPAEEATAALLDGAPAVAHVAADRGPDAAVTVARLGRLGAAEERLVPPLGTRRGREESGRRVDVAPDDVVRSRERRLPPGRRRRADEIDPDRERAFRAGEAGRRTVVVADPDPGEHVRREPDEPGVAGVVGRAGLARRGAVEPEPARAARRARVDDALEEMGHQVGDARLEDARRLARGGVQHLAGRRRDGDDDRRRP